MMPSRTPGGTYTNKFDVVTTPHVLDRLDATNERIDKLDARFTDPVQVEIDNLKSQLVELRDSHNELAARYDALRIELNLFQSLVQRFFNSKFFRFLNFFGKWFVIDGDGRLQPYQRSNTDPSKRSSSAGHIEGNRGQDPED